MTSRTESLALALDWTANANHVGFFVAEELGGYRDAGLEVRFTTPADDNYASTPVKRLERGEVQLALCPLESVLSYRTKARPFDAVAIAALFREDLSAIVALASNADVRSPRDLDGRRYASYAARYEDGIVRQMVINDGGTGRIEIDYPDKLGIWETLIDGRADATWVFMNWEGVQARGRGLELNAFRLADHGIPYSYSPVIATGEALVETHRPALSRFLAATREGFLRAAADPELGARVLAPRIAEADRDIDLVQSVIATSTACGTAERWGVLDERNVSAFLDWLRERGLEHSRLGAHELIDAGVLADA